MQPVLSRGLARWLALGTLVAGLLPATGGAAPPDKAAAAALGSGDARTWLARIRAAANAGNYVGTMVLSMDGTMSSSRVAHFSVGDHVYERLEALDGRQQQILRHDDAVHTMWPQMRVAIVEKRETLAGWSTTPQEIDPQALDQYEFRSEGSGRVAGRDAVVFVMEPRDALRYAQRLWADRATALMLRADVLGPAPAGAGRPVLESTAFSEIAIGVKSQHDTVIQAMRNPRRLDGWRVHRPQQQRTTLEAQGWVLARPVPGFSLAGCVRRGMVETAGDDEPVLQAVFADGLTHVSVFIEPFRAQHHRAETQAQQGATSTLMQRRGEHWLTVVGDVPPATLKLFAEAVERRRP